MCSCISLKSFIGWDQGPLLQRIVAKELMVDFVYSFADHILAQLAAVGSFHMP